MTDTAVITTAPETTPRPDYIAILESNPMLWGYTLIGKLFYKNPPKFHLRIMDAIMQNSKVAIAAPRGHAKSSIVSFLYVLHCICYSKKNFIAIFSSTKEKAASHFKGVREQLAENTLIHAFHGKPEFKKLTEYEMVIKFPGKDSIRLVSWGQEQIEIVRGEKHNGRRPDLILLDDIEFQELVNSPERRRTLKQDFDEALLPSGEYGVTQYIVVGTILHFDSLLSHLLNPDTYRDWHKMFYKTSVENPLWPEMVSSDELYRIKKNSPIVYAKEYQNNPIAGELLRFSRDDFRYYLDEKTEYVLLDSNSKKIGRGSYRDCIPAIGCDLAWSEKKTADFSVLLSMLLTPDNNYIVYDYVAKRGMRPEELANILFTKVKYLQQLTGTRPNVGFEKAIIERISKEFLKKEMARRNEFFIIKPAEWKTDKITRIEMALQHLYANHVLYHRRNMTELEDQLYQFPDSKNDDLPDAEQIAIQLLKFPKTLRKSIASPESEDPMFDWVRKNMLPGNRDTATKRPGEFLFGKRHEPIKSKISFMGGA